MRKSEREVKDIQEKLDILMHCPYLILSLKGEEAPYCIPLNFGAELVGDTLCIYFHCAKEGKKLELLRKDGKVGFSAANMLRVFNKGIAPCGYTTDYESVCGYGHAAILQSEEERLRGLKILMAHYTGEAFSDESFLPRALALTEVVRIEVSAWTAKRLIREQSTNI